MYHMTIDKRTTKHSQSATHIEMNFDSEYKLIHAIHECVDYIIFGSSELGIWSASSVKSLTAIDSFNCQIHSNYD